MKKKLLKTIANHLGGTVSEKITILDGELSNTYSYFKFKDKSDCISMKFFGQRGFIENITRMEIDFEFGEIVMYHQDIVIYSIKCITINDFVIENSTLVITIDEV